MKQTSISFILFFAIAILIGTGCDSKRIFENYHQIDETGWHKDSLVVFHFAISNTLQNHNLYVNVRNSLDYKYQNLWLFINIEQPGGTVATDTFEMLLANPAGEWLGEGFGGLKEIQKKYRSNVFFPVTGEYTISLQQGMRNELLGGIHDVGFRVEKTE